MRQEERFHRRASGVKARESAEGNGSAGESRLVAVTAEDGVDASESSSGTAHSVIRWDQTFAKFVPCTEGEVSKRVEMGKEREGRTRGSARENNLDENASEVHVTECRSPELDSAGRGEDEEEGGDDEGQDEMHEPVREPRHQIENGVSVSSEEVRDVGAVENRFEGREDGNPDVRAVVFGDELGGVEEEEPGEDGGCGEEELRGEGDEHGEGVDGDEEDLEEEGMRHDGQGEEGELCKEAKGEFSDLKGKTSCLFCFSVARRSF
jgi:hypothetical protein